MVAFGTPEEKGPALGLDPGVAANSRSYTGQYLKQVLARRGGAKAASGNGKRFAGMFAKPARRPAQFLPMGVGIDQQEEDAVKLYCRDDGIYLPQ